MAVLRALYAAKSTLHAHVHDYAEHGRSFLVTNDQHFS